MYLVGGPVKVRTYHAALEWFNTQPKLSNRQARWSIALQEHNVEFKYVAGKSNVVADALSRQDLQLKTCAIQLRRRTRQGSYLQANEEEFGPTVLMQEVSQHPILQIQEMSPKRRSLGLLRVRQSCLRPCLTQSVLRIVRKI
jgi:hypothetical protein